MSPDTDRVDAAPQDDRCDHTRQDPVICCPRHVGGGQFACSKCRRRFSLVLLSISFVPADSLRSLCLCVSTQPGIGVEISDLLISTRIPTQPTCQLDRIRSSENSSRVTVLSSPSSRRSTIESLNTLSSGLRRKCNPCRRRSLCTTVPQVVEYQRL